MLSFTGSVKPGHFQQQQPIPAAGGCGFMMVVISGVRHGVLCSPQPGWESGRTPEGYVYYFNPSESTPLHHWALRHV